MSFLPAWMNDRIDDGINRNGTKLQGKIAEDELQIILEGGSAAGRRVFLLSSEDL